jgi:hypothetical protein
LGASGAARSDFLTGIAARSWDATKSGGKVWVTALFTGWLRKETVFDLI